MATKDFDAMLAEKAGIRPTFKVGGQFFTARARLPYKRFQKLMAVMGADETDPDEATEMFFRKILVKQDVDRFIALLNDEDEDDEADDAALIDTSQLSELTTWLMEIYTGKAEASSSSSSNGRDTTGPLPKLVSLTSRAG